MLSNIMDNGTFMLCRLAAIVLITPTFLIPGVLVGLVGAWCGQVYIAGQLSVKREVSDHPALALMCSLLF